MHYARKNTQDSDGSWVWGSREEWKSEMCKPKYQGKVTVLFMVDECFWQDFRSRAWFWPLWGAVLDFHKLAQKMHSSFNLDRRENDSENGKEKGITITGEPGGRRNKAKIVRGKDISKLERMEREGTGHLARKLRLGLRANESKEMEDGGREGW